MGIFDGFSRGLASAALGAQTGAIKGEAEVRRRQTQDVDAEYKKQALAQKKKELDPGKQARDLARGIAQKLGENYSNPENEQVFQTNPGYRAEYLRRLAHVTGVANGTIPVDQLDLAYYGQLVQHSTPEAPRSPFADVTQGPEGQAVLPEPTGAPDVTRSAAPEYPLVVTPKQRVANDRIDIGQGNLGLRTEIATTNAPLIQARTKGVQQQNAIRPQKEALGMERTRAGIGLTKEQTRTSKALTPEKVKNIRSQVATREGQLQQGEQRLSETERHNRRQETAANLDRKIKDAQQKDTESYHNALKKKVAFYLDNYSDAELGKDLRAKLAADSRLASAAVSVGRLKTSKAAEAGPEVWNRLQKTVAEIDARQKKGGAGPAQSAPPAAGAQPTISQQTLGIVKGLIAGGKFRTQLETYKNDPERKGHLLRAYKQLKGRDYFGAP